eukprot:scaffold1521_cov109-Cylindrotheca_fusiformis.AAC.1
MLRSWLLFFNFLANYYLARHVNDAILPPYQPIRRRTSQCSDPGGESNPDAPIPGVKRTPTLPSLARLGQSGRLRCG